MVAFGEGSPAVAERLRAIMSGKGVVREWVAAAEVAETSCKTGRGADKPKDDSFTLAL
jgi:hypothetical protein